MRHMKINDLVKSHRKFVAEEGINGSSPSSHAYSFVYKITPSVPKEKALLVLGQHY